MPTRPRVLVVQHEDDCPVGMIEPWLHRAGIDCDVLQAHRGRALPASLGDHIALIVLGGSMGANDDAQHRWLVPTKALIAITVAGGWPFLGVCLGHQLAAVALGGQVERNSHGPFQALAPFGPDQAARSDTLLSALPRHATVLHWNNDVVTTLPPRAVRLAQSPDGTVQAARFGPRAWGVQFHPEVDADIVARWQPGPDPEHEAKVIAELEHRRHELHRSWESLIRRFARIARSD
ncbi:MAG: type 1 glutamine amidotransferase [Ornithinimicrobium sp.]|uniref:type 1 glutamine amidotransferase n=1 Tax=Ornithinimicrobium sp. TaxID=1977084 RepID=UPI0026DF8E57|nr:type 1 glutamine amidotransferase [Ornithinimicrobium sp.]MDO5739079.1 type 1 glutamine amidotransferase [Ornithinimicrobium sp.]